MTPLHVLLDQLESHMPSKDVANLTVSEREVGWHIAHSLKVIDQIAATVQNSDPALYRWKFNWKRSLVYTTNQIPRGKARSPKSVLPSENMTGEQWNEEFQKAKAAILALDSLAPNKYFTHPFFGMLDVKRSKKFLALHTQHHLKIIEDIVKPTL